MKNKKLIGLASLMLVLGATGCPKKECETHTWGEEEVVTAPTCTEAGKGKHVCTVCGKEEETTIKKKGHKYVDDATGAVAPTCTEDGSKGQTCENCGDKKTVPVSKLGHKWVDDETGAVEATCTEAGSKGQHCERCTATQTVTIDALGHSFGSWEVVEGKEPTCTKAGEEKRVCSRCSVEETQPKAALGHKPVVKIAGDPAAAGKASVNIYECANGCGETFLGFKANEVSEGSREHLTFTEPDENNEVGASFWGRPIGNSLSLNPQNGDSVNQRNNECVYCSTETGDYFEYVFDLTAEQAAALSTCLCYCDARPANYLSGDFWAYNASSDDWTPGYYIDGADEHVEHNEDNTVKMVPDHTRCERSSNAPGDEIPESSVPMGKRITDYRYVLYYNDHIQQFDDSMSVPVEGSGANMVRKEYVMPFVFHLQEGENKISLRMAGGYRSVFYNFIFRPYVVPTDVTVNETTLAIDEGATGQITSTMEGLTYESDKPEIATVDENGVVTGVKAGTATITVSKEGNFKPAKVQVTVNSVAHVHAFGNPVNVDAVADTSVAYTKETCECGAIKYTMSAVDMNNTITAEGQKLPKGASGKYDGTAWAKYVFNADEMLDGAFYAYGGVDNGSNYGLHFQTGKNGGNSKVDPLPDGKTNTLFKLNDNALTVCDDPYNNLVDLNGTLDEAHAANPNNETTTRAGLIKIADATLAAGANKFEMAGADSYGIVYLKIVFIGVPHQHAFGAAETLTAGEGEAVVKKSVCACGVVKYEIEAKTGNFVLDGSSAWKSDATNPTKGDYFKLASDNQSFHFTFALPKGFTGKMYQRGYMDAYNSNKGSKLYYGRDVSNIEVKVGENAIDMTSDWHKNVKFSDVFGDGSDVDASGNSPIKDVLIGDVTLGTANTMSYKRVKTLNLTVSAFVFIGTEVDA